MSVEEFGFGVAAQSPWCSGLERSMFRVPKSKLICVV